MDVDALTLIGRHQPVAHPELVQHRRHGVETEPKQQVIDGDRPALSQRPSRVVVGSRGSGPRDRIDIEHHATGDGLVASRFAQHEPVTGKHRKGDGGVDANGPVRSRRQRLPAEHSDPNRHRPRADVPGERPPAGEVVTQVGEHGHRGIHRRRVPPTSRCDHRVTALDIDTVDTRERDGHSPPGSYRCEVATIRLKPTHPSRSTPRPHLDGVVDRQRATGERPGHHRARTGRREHPVDP